MGPRRPLSQAAALAACLLLLLVSTVLLLAAASVPDVRPLRAGWPERTAFMERRAAEAAERGEPFSISWQPVPLQNIPEHVRRAVLVSEDAAFWAHRGFDWHELRSALLESLRERSPPRGASTITQQLARNLYLSPERSLYRKLTEAMITRRLEARLSKPRILELYLNVIELGPGVFGVEAASRRYFGASVSGLNRLEAASLAATIPSPRRHNPATDTRSHRWRRQLIYERAFGAPAGEGDSSEEEKNGRHFSGGEGSVRRLTTMRSEVETSTAGITM